MVAPARDLRPEVALKLRQRVVARHRHHLRLPRLLSESPRERLLLRIEHDPRLGVWRDADLARSLRCTVHIVVQTRRGLGIPAPDVPSRCTPALRVAIAGHPKLGKVIDRIIAEELGVRASTVRQVRDALGVPSCRSAWGAHNAPVAAGGDLRLSPVEQAVVDLLRARGPTRRARVRAAIALAREVTRDTVSNAIRRVLRDGLALETDDHVLSLAEGA